MSKHKHYKEIVAWAEGKQIQVNNNGYWQDIDKPMWLDMSEYREKPEPKHDIGVWASVGTYNTYGGFTFCGGANNLFLTFDGETGELKGANVISKECK